MELKIKIIQPALTDKKGGARHIWLNGTKLEYAAGTLPANRQLACYNKPTDITAFAGDLYKLKLVWTQDRSADGLATTGATNMRKAASGNITFEGDAYKYLKAWLIDDQSAAMNTLEIQIEDGCGTFIDWEVRASDISWCEGDMCSMDVSLKQKDPALTCIKNTWIADNHLGWFGDTKIPQNNKKHPRFSYCTEIRPNGMVVTVWFLMTQLMTMFMSMLTFIAPVVNSIIFTLKNIIYPIINLILGILGKKKLDRDRLQYIEFGEVRDAFVNFFTESGGCGREHPAPLIRDYIYNVCKKCGVDVNADSAPIFFSQTLPIETAADRQANRGVQLHPNPHYNACYFYAVSDKGVRRYDSSNIFSGAQKNTTDYWLPGNSPLLTLSEFLDQLKTLYNCEWRLENNTLVFKRKDHWQHTNTEFDFTHGSPDRDLLLEGICYEWDETKTPVYGRGIYAADPSDVCGNNAVNQMNGLVSFGSIDTNPQLDGVMDKTVQFGATKFRLDGSSTDYLYDAMQQVVNTTLISGALWTTPMMSTINTHFREFANYALLLKQETAVLPKVLIWDGQSFDNAKCVRPYKASVSFGGSTPAPSKKYNPNNIFWQHRHEPETKVSGRKLVPPPQPFGAYEVRGLFGALVTFQEAMLVNYPMYFEPFYEGTLWDWFHWIDDANENPTMHQRFSLKLKLCCETMNKIKPYMDASSILLGQKVKLPLPYFNEGRITEIEVSYDVTTDVGPYIQLKGTV